MKFDYWNNPMIVKAMRTKYRGGRIYSIATIYLSLLLIAGMIAFIYRFEIGEDKWLRTYIVGMFGVQFLISVGIALTSTSVSMASEVATRTMDFQRITSLKPRAILLGKMFGEPASSYMLILATIPFATVGCALGAISPFAAIMLYITLFTTTLMAASFGIQHSLEPSTTSQNPANQAAGLLIFFFMVGVQGIFHAAAGNLGKVGSVIFGLITPALSLKGILLQQNPYMEQFPVFDFQIPYLFLTPIFQLWTAYSGLDCMARKLTHPLTTRSNKMFVYVNLIAFDLVWAAYAFGQISFGAGVTDPALAYSLGHSVISLILLISLTPNRETFESWVWRFRGRRPLIHDLLDGERSMNLLAAPVTMLLGVIGFLVFLVVPAVLKDGQIMALTQWNTVAWLASTTSLAVIAFAYFFQWAILTSGKGAGALLFFVIFVTNLVPYVIGYRYDNAFIRDLSIVSALSSYFRNPLAGPSLAPTFLLHLVLALLSLLGMLRWSHILRTKIDKKVQMIGAAAQLA